MRTRSKGKQERRECEDARKGFGKLRPKARGVGVLGQGLSRVGETGAGLRKGLRVVDASRIRGLRGERERVRI